MNALPIKARIYIALVSATGTVIAIYFAYLANDQGLWLPILGVSILVAVLDGIPVKPYGSDVEMTTSDIAKFASILLFPSPVPILGAFFGTLVGELASKRAWFKRLFNISVLTITIFAATAVYQTINRPQTDLLSSTQSILALIFAGLTDFGVNSVLVSLVIAIVQGMGLHHAWLQNYPKVALYDLSLIPLGTFLAILWRFSSLSIVLAILPLMIVRQSYQIANHLQRQTEDALKALMRVIDERDNETSDHSERVSRLAKEIGKALHLPPGELDALVPAASLHDLGKVGMPSDILHKSSSLTPEERQRAQQHAAAGGDLLSKFPLFRKGALLVRHHHERYDGKGYPDGLKGDKIPIGARIIAVADSFEAMTEDRPYREALSKDDAVAELFRCSGTQFDPMVVHGLIKVMGKESPVIREAILSVRLPLGVE